MGNWDSILLMALFVVLVFGLYFFFINIHGEKLQYKEYSYNFSNENLSNYSQFYPNMRYKYSNISYRISDACDSAKKIEAENALFILSNKTRLTFYPDSSSPQINILCTNIEQSKTKEGYLIAGEGGPSKVIPVGNYYLILEGKVSLYRTEKCQSPQVAVHEILHALGFDHNKNPGSIMYPITTCEQTIDDYIINDIDIIYRLEPHPDLVIEYLSNVSIDKGLMDFNISVANRGLDDAKNATLLLLNTDNSTIKEFSLGGINVGVKKTLIINNLKVPSGLKKAIFEVEVGGDEKELEYDNNLVELTAVGA